MENNIQQEPVYLNYGSDQIDQAQFFTRAADNVTNWVNSQSWSKKRKERFMNAYSDIISKGIIGASNDTGQWTVDLKSSIDLESMSKKDQEMYHEAAYYILQQMKGSVRKSSRKKDQKVNEETGVGTGEDQKIELPLFNNEYFNTQLQNYIGRNEYGNRNYTFDEWNERDSKDPNTGIRGTTNRAETLARMLEGYSNSLREGQYNFEGTAYTDLNDLKTKISNAVQALRDGVWDQNDIDALNRLGIDPNQYLYTGSNEQVQLENGQTVTRQQVADAIEQQTNLQEIENTKKELEKQQAEEKNNLGVLDVRDGIIGTHAKDDPEGYSKYLAEKLVGTGEEGYNALNEIVQDLLEKSYNETITDQEKIRLGNLLYYIRHNNPAYKGLGYGQKTGISQAEFDELMIHKNVYSQNINDYMKLPWKTSDGRSIYADNKGHLYYLKPSNHKQLESLQLDRSKIDEYKKNYLISSTNEGQRQLAAERGLFEGGLREKAVDYYRIQSTFEDILAGVCAFVPEYGTAIAAALSVKSLRDDFIADAFDKSVSVADMGWNTLTNFGLGVVGLIPGAKWVASSGKWVKALAKYAPFIVGTGTVGYQALQHHPEMIASWKKLMNKEDLTITDWKNIGLSGRILFGLLRTGKGAYDAHKYGQTNPGTTQTKKVSTYKDGKPDEVILSKSEFETLNKKTNRADAEKFLKDTGHEGHTLPHFVDDKHKLLPLRSVKIPGTNKIVRERVKGTNYAKPNTPTEKQVQLQQKFTAQDEAAKKKLIEGKGVFRVLPESLRQNLSEWLPTNYQIYGTPLSSTTAAATTTTATTVKPVTAKDVGLPKHVDLTAWYENRIGKRGNINRSARPLDQKKDYNATVNFTPDGDKLNIKISNGELIISDEGGVIKQQKLNSDNYTQEAKVIIGNTIQKQREQLISSGKIRKHFTKEFIQSLKDLKKQGLLFRKGGVIY